MELMNDADLDRTYTALCRALGEVGAERSELLLSMVCLGLVARSEEAGTVLELIARAQQRLQEDPGSPGSTGRNGLAATPERHPT